MAGSHLRTFFTECRHALSEDPEELRSRTPGTWTFVPSRQGKCVYAHAACISGFLYFFGNHCILCQNGARIDERTRIVVLPCRRTEYTCSGASQEWGECCHHRITHTSGLAPPWSGRSPIVQLCVSHEYERNTLVDKVTSTRGVRCHVHFIRVRITVTRKSSNTTASSQGKLL